MVTRTPSTPWNTGYPTRGADIPTTPSDAGGKNLVSDTRYGLFSGIFLVTADLPEDAVLFPVRGNSDLGPLVHIDVRV